MTKQTVVSFNMKELDEIQKQLGSSYYARVGILGGHAARTGEGKDDLNNATIGLIMMFGSLTKNIPPRDFLVEPIRRQSRELLEALKKASIQAAIAKGDIKRAYALLGAIAEKLVDVAFQTSGFGQWPANKPSTIARKGSSKVLIDTGQLRRSITSDVVKR